jgi:hypothetical protein
LGIRRFILNIEPLLALALDGVGKLQVKISDFWPNANANTNYIVDGVLRVVAAEVKKYASIGPSEGGCPGSTRIEGQRWRCGGES